MADRLTNIEFLLMLSENVRAQGDDLSDEMNRQGTAHARKIMELEGMLDKAQRILAEERERFAPYFPKPEPKEKLPRAVTQGPREHPTPTTGPRAGTQLSMNPNPQFPPGAELPDFLKGQDDNRGR